MKKFALILCLQFFSVALHAQVKLEIINAVTDTVTTYSEVDTISGVIMNDSFQQLFFDSIYIFAQVNGVTFPAPLTVVTAQLAPGDTIGFSQTYTITGNFFMPGNNIVVVWPVAPWQGTVTDSTTLTVFVVSDVGLSEQDVINNACYPSLLAPGTHLVCGEGIEKVTMRDLSGREVQLTNGRIIPSNITKGIYLLEWYSKDRRSTSKVLVQ